MAPAAFWSSCMRMIHERLPQLAADTVEDWMASTTLTDALPSCGMLQMGWTGKVLLGVHLGSTCRLELDPPPTHPHGAGRRP